MLEFKTEKTSARITRIYGFCTELMYLVEGDHQAALLDTGSGFGSLRAAVDKLTKKPVIALLTHGHVDHAMGAGEFETTYMNRNDDYIFIPHGEKNFRWDGVKMAENYASMTEADYIPTADVNSFHDLRDGDRFDLGGVSVEIYALPGHTRGSLIMLIGEDGGERFLLTGDACNSFTFMFQDYSLPIAAYEENLRTLAARLKGKFDRVLASHGDGSLPLDIMDGVLAVCGDIKNGRVDDVPLEFMGNKGLIAKAPGPLGGRADGGHGNIVYNKAKT
jgi:glyoxylase-like metal-dependent hydrolase (beta-lactamase superfamily II)